MSDNQGYQPTAAAAWLRILHGDSPGHLSIVSTDDWAGRTFPTHDIDQAAAYVAELHAAGREGIYARVTTLTTPPAAGKRAGAADSAALPALWADLDLAGPGHVEQDLPPDEQAGRAVIAASGLPEPTLWVHSGGGLYPIWLLTEPHLLAGQNETATTQNLDAAKRLAKDWQAVIEHAAASLGYRYGRGVGDLARVLRIPGTVNRKAGLERPCRIVLDPAPPGTRYTYPQLVDALDTAVARIAPPETVPATPAVIGAASTTTPRPAGDLSPGDDYAAKTTWPTILEQAGWREHYRADDATYWTRPGKTTGTSASTNALGTDRLHIFTTSAPPFEGGESYSKFGAYALLRCGGDHTTAARELAAAGYGAPLPSPAAAIGEAFDEILGYPMPDPPPPPPAPPVGRGLWTPEVDVTNHGAAGDWLRDTLGRDRLAGYFNRVGQIVHTPREGEDGYVPPLHDGDDDGPAQVRTVNDSTLASRITYTYGVFRLVKEGKDWVSSQTIFPKPAARLAVDAADMMPNLRALRGVVHSPVLRGDGSVLSTPGYDHDTGLLHLPEAGLTVDPVPDRPDGAQVADAVALLQQMIDGFQFISKHDHANYLGMLLTPLLRAIAPPPYQLGAITAPQPGSGKTLLATCARIIHGGVFRAEMPATDDELRKQITGILDHTTGPIIHIDNVSGTLRSSVVAGLLTSARWDDRRLGTNELVHAHNDRLWIVTGNNLSLGGDLARRTLWVTIDPGVPDPHLRTGFAITDLERWTAQHRAQLIHALLTLTRAWVSQGMPMAAARSSDSYSRWVQVIGGILACVGIEGTFAAAESQHHEMGADDNEWHDFLTHIAPFVGDEEWCVKDLIGKFSNGTIIDTGGIPLDALPDYLHERAQRNGGSIATIGKSLGRWISKQEGRWAGGLTVRQAGPKRADGTPWVVVKAEAAK